jgi:hypothetical protein
MRNLAELHSMHSKIISEIKFLKTELKFLLKLINREYAISIDNTKIRVLDGYYIRFEENIGALEKLSKDINEEEKDLKNLYKNELIDLENTEFKDWEKTDFEIIRILKETKVLKESFYDFMINR